MQDFEKLGAFYLGKSFDLAARKRQDALMMYDAKDLVTHSVCVGMTGSGKTGLCLALLEEAAIDGIPAIIIDPKGDLGNLMLTFPGLKGSDFRPWINEEDAQKKGLTPDQFAEAQAALWTKGLGDWGQDGARIQRLRDAAEVVIYTPGSSAGLPVSILKSFDAPEAAIRDDAELFRDRVATSVSSLLGLLGLDADPIRSREHILLSNLFSAAWTEGRGLELGTLIEQIQKPPMTRIGVMDIESVFPGKDRFALAMQINNLLAAPGFASWLEGEALDIGAMLRTPAGKPRQVIFSIAHLGDAERMFFVSLLYNQILGWTRAQSGTTSLRAIVYMDEIAGYFPPTANPPSKQPMLTMMKQARAFGVGMMLATQNPVDLDYKGLANAGTWFIGRLQTQRDKDRVLDGLEGAAASASAKFDRAAADKAMSALGNRVFLMNNVHEDATEIFETRWCMSYLRGPLTRNQIKTLMDPVRGSVGRGIGKAVSAPRASSSGASVGGGGPRPVLPGEIAQVFLPVRSSKPQGARLVYEPRVMGVAKIYYQDNKTGVDTTVDQSLLGGFAKGTVAFDWESAEPTEFTDADMDRAPAEGPSFSDLPSEASKPKSYEAWKKSLTDAMFRSQKLELLYADTTEQYSKPGEKEREFRARMDQSARELRDDKIEALRAKIAPKVAMLQERLRKAEAAQEAKAANRTSSILGAAVSVGSAVLSGFLGRKTISAASVSKAATAMRAGSRVYKDQQAVGAAADTVEAVQQQIADLDAQLKSDIDEISSATSALTAKLATVTVRPKKTNISVKMVALAWTPTWVDESGDATPAWE
jgi:Helicase HerA, central domain